MTDGETLGDLSHTNPYTGEAFGETQTYTRGKQIAADGGQAEAETDAEADDGDRISDVDHTPPGDAPAANAAYDHEDSNDREDV